jgi:rhodanese-related sulfurtransferase
METKSNNGNLKVIIVGGVAGGASCAARLRRLDENVEIIMVERGPYVSYANCGLPYYVGGVIPRESSLLVADERTFRSMFAIDVRTICHWDSEEPKFLLDVRHPQELTIEIVPGAVNIPLDELRDRLDELPRDREIRVFCRSGQRAYYATRVLLQNGFNVRNLAGGMMSRENLAADCTALTTI